MLLNPSDDLDMIRSLKEMAVYGNGMDKLTLLQTRVDYYYDTKARITTLFKGSATCAT